MGTPLAIVETCRDHGFSIVEELNCKSLGERRSVSSLYPTNGRNVFLLGFEKLSSDLTY